jgi:hypothetical protein
MRLLLASLTVATASLFAQANDPATKKVDVKFRALSFDAPIIGSGFLDGRDAKRLDISNDFLSGEQTYRGLATIAFVMVDDLAKQAPEVPLEILAASGRRSAAQERARKASEEYTRLSALIAKATTGSREGQAGKISASELAEAEAAQAKLSELSRIMAEASKDADDAQTEVNNRQRDHQQALTEAKSAKAAKGKAPTKAPAADKGKDPKGPFVPPVPFASYTFPADGKYILLFAGADKDKRIMAIEDKEGTFPFGSYLYINLTGKPVEVRYNGKSTPIAPNGRAVISAPVANDTYAQGEILTPGEDGFQIGYIARTYQQADVRTLFFLLPSDAGGHSINIKGIEERKQPDPVPDPNAGAAKGGKAASK